MPKVKKDMENLRLEKKVASKKLKKPLDRMHKVLYNDNEPSGMV